MKLEDLSDDDFEKLDHTRPLSPNEVYAVLPRDAVIRGMFFFDLQDLLGPERAQAHPLTRGAYQALTEYPMIDFCRACVHTAETVFPEVPLREGLRRVGRTVFPRFASTRLGKLTFGIFGQSLTGIGSAAAKGYRHAIRPGEVRVLELTSHRATFHLKDVYNFIDSYQVGAFEGAIEATGRRGEITAKPISVSEIVIRATWD